MTEQGVPAAELSDEDLVRQGVQAHATRNWVFLHGTAEQFQRHTERMLELEQEYLRRYPKRTWQGSGGADAGGTRPSANRSRAQVEEDLLRRYAAAPGGRLHKLEAHQAAREVGLAPPAVAALFKAEPPLLVTAGEHRQITDAGRARLG